MNKPNPGTALANLRWAKLTPEQRLAQLAKTHAGRKKQAKALRKKKALALP